MFYEKIKKQIKKKSSIWFSTIIPSKIPEFCVYDVKEPILFLYFVNGDIFYISNKSDKVFNEVKIDEIIKVGIHNNEFGFYPVMKDSEFFKNKYELNTFKFIELIIANNLNMIVSRIFDEIKFFEDKVLEYKMLYLLKLKDLICNIEFNDEFNILKINDNLRWESENTLKYTISQIVQNNLIDSKQNIFDILFKDGIYDTEPLLENNHYTKQDMLKNYYNKSNLSDNTLEHKAKIIINNRIFFITYFIDSIFLQYNISKKMFANANISIKGIDLCGYQDILYSNNDLKVEFGIDEILIYNQQKSNIVLHSIYSVFILSEKQNVVSMENLNLVIEDSVSFELDLVLKDLHLYLDYKLQHKVEIIYSTTENKRKLVGSSSYTISDICNNIFSLK
ncbi:hypothetical protein [Helicobacter sp. MIT 14-3879]|uniref:hypothetical protein n=1 Tax=Helicobacter sp. MIT 14-3879 TaxID=2040649 RepID=UPI000E1F51A3|nr:hypothetical protein [Helicobacter sp. MIT 14-3879]RDU64830.1 hypothetical protein CQA44_03730 [Helicobacter sp. MIT 14-3879]